MLAANPAAAACLAVTLAAAAFSVRRQLATWLLCIPATCSCGALAHLAHPRPSCCL